MATVFRKLFNAILLTLNPHKTVQCLYKKGGKPHQNLKEEFKYRKWIKSYKGLNKIFEFF